VTWATPLVRLRSALSLFIAAMLSFVPLTPAAAEGKLFAPQTVSALVDIRAVAAGGEPSWTEDQFGKARFGQTGDVIGTPVFAEAALAWQPELRWDVNGTVVVVAQHEQDKLVDLVEAYLSYKPVPRSATRFSVRAGLYWPAVSLEHEGAFWSVADMITPSAINSWIGEEVKTVGAEALASREIDGNRVSATIGLFGFNDTAGTLMAFRGWALHDLKAGAFGHHPLPELNYFMQGAQAPTTKPLIELDGRPGFYGKISWEARAPVRLEAFYFDNRGDPTAVNGGLQWGWDTKFLNLGVRIDFSEDTRLLAQALSGSTRMGYPDAQGREWIETRFRAAYARLTHKHERLALSGRIDLFDTSEEGSRMSADESERGWSAAAAAGWTFSGAATLIAEVLHIDSDRGTRRRAGFAPAQAQTVFQLALRLTL
jgi:hypothetical protein